MNSFSIELGVLLRESRDKKKMSMMSLAEKAQINQTHLSYIERGMRTPSPELLIELANILAEDQKEIEPLKEKFLFLLTKIKAPEEIRDKLSLSKSASDAFLKEPHIAEVLRTLKNMPPMQRNLFCDMIINMFKTMSVIAEKKIQAKT